jgi:hypothetical protein
LCSGKNLSMFCPCPETEFKGDGQLI